MISIIICSIKPELAEQLKANCAKNIGCDHEVIIFDNRKTGYGICKVYNLCAEKAKGEYLCFIHEDTLINTEGWGEIITRKLDEPTCGIIGFAGAKIKSQAPSPWGQNKQFNILNITQQSPNDNKQELCGNKYTDLDYVPVVSIDGVFMIMRRQVWETHKYDEFNLTAFHCYDIDISLNVAQNHTNYVCNIINLTHFSEGNINTSWIEESIILHNKWRDKLPMHVGNIPQKAIDKNEETSAFFFTKCILKSKYPRKIRHYHLSKYLKSKPRLVLRIQILSKCVKYSLLRK